MNHIQQTLIAEGREVKSDYIIRAVGEEQYHRFYDKIYPKGGTLIAANKNAFQWHLRIKDSYAFSDPDKVGR